jgi:hypothetical protein
VLSVLDFLKENPKIVDEFKSKDNIIEEKLNKFEKMLQNKIEDIPMFDKTEEEIYNG